MKRFSYIAERAGGESYTGVADANDRFELYTIVRREGGRIVSFSEEGAGGFLSLDWLNSLLSTIKEYDKIVFARNLGAMLSAGLPLSRALAVMERQIKSPKLKGVVTGIASDVRRGSSLHETLGKFPRIFSNLFAAMVRSGEEGGSLPDALSVVSEQMERMYQLKKKIRGALIYPAIIVVAIIGIGTIMMIYVVPTLAQTFEEMNAQLPFTTRVIIGISDFLVEHTVLVIAGAVGLLALLIVAARTAPGKRVLDAFFLHIPMIGIMVKEVNSARTARTLSSLLQSGVDVLASLEIARQVVQNSYFREVIKDAGVRVGKGEPLSVAFSRRGDLYPSFVPEMMAVGEETGALSEMLKRLANFYEEEVDRKTKDMSTIIEPFLMIVIGSAVGFFAVSMIMPIYSLSQNIG
ncbi:type II secretion system F family protein [Candidatus Kaiserbacteria bacterium]|nr:type II secretion system F family protein [Candidatus Kaiserbacteria bacterium]